MHPRFTDVTQTLQFGREKAGQKHFVIGAIALVAGGLMIALAADGLRYNIELAKEIFVPWHEVKALRRIDVNDTTGASKWPLRAKFENVVALVVTNAFYDRAIHIANPILRGPGWGNIFIPDERNNVMQFALHHEILPVTAEELYAAVEARWMAFRDKTAPSANKAAP